ncbi:MAG: hypothetical protein AB1432_05535 [Bacteroidota bacterium]|jgi:hypothetical protein
MKCEKCGKEFSESVYPLHLERCKSKVDELSTGKQNEEETKTESKEEKEEVDNISTDAESKVDELSTGKRKKGKQ